jgi:hypothetical protein
MISSSKAIRWATYQWADLDFISEGRLLLAACTGLVAGGASAREGAHGGLPTESGPRVWKSTSGRPGHRHETPAFSPDTVGKSTGKLRLSPL